jgi:Relaxase/Mobilisation nuclease domain
MIIKGSSRAGGAALGVHLNRTDTNERVAVLELRGVSGLNLDEGLREMEALGAGTRCKSPLYHANIDPRADEVLTPQQWSQAVDALEAKLGLTDQPRAVVQHVKEGRAHVHVVWSRIDLENNRAISDSHNYRKHEEVARSLEREFGHARVQGAHVEREGKERPARTPSHAEMQQAGRSGLDPKAIKAEVTALWQQADSGKAFATALTAAGYTLARGEKRDFILVDQAGETHSLARRIDGAKAADIRAKLADVDQAKLPDAGAAKALQADRQAEQQRQAAQAAQKAEQARQAAEAARKAEAQRQVEEAMQKAQRARWQAMTPKELAAEAQRLEPPSMDKVVPEIAAANKAHADAEKALEDAEKAKTAAWIEAREGRASLDSDERRLRNGSKIMAWLHDKGIYKQKVLLAIDAEKKALEDRKVEAGEAVKNAKAAVAAADAERKRVLAEPRPEIEAERAPVKAKIAEILAIRSEKLVQQTLQRDREQAREDKGREHDGR